MENKSNYWFMIEPYVFVSITNLSVLLYNTLDGAIIESEESEILELLQEVVLKENGGVVLLSKNRCNQKNIKNFIVELRDKYMGDIIDASFSKGKPIQIMPYINFSQKNNKKYNFYLLENIFDLLSEITFHIDHTTDIPQLILMIQLMPKKNIYSIKVTDYNNKDLYRLLNFLDVHSLSNSILCPYNNIIGIDSINKFSYKISVCFPLDYIQFKKSIELLRLQNKTFEYIFYVDSLEDCEQTNMLIDHFNIKKYQLKPIYTGDNISFFEENVFLVKEDILEKKISIKDFFFKQNMNTYDFGKLNIMPNGDVFANMHYPSLGNIYINSTEELIHKELDLGKSWLRIRNQDPCDRCVYQWLCPSPSDYEIIIKKNNLCHLKTTKHID